MILQVNNKLGQCQYKGLKLKKILIENFCTKLIKTLFQVCSIEKSQVLHSFPQLYQASQLLYRVAILNKTQIKMTVPSLLSNPNPQQPRSLIDPTIIPPTTSLYSQPQPQKPQKHSYSISGRAYNN